jgi:hypothetical protein
VSLTRVQNVSISLDGFGTGQGQSDTAHFGHAGDRLHQWMFATRWWHQQAGQPGGSGGIDDAFARQHDPGIGAEIMGPTSSATPAGTTTPTGRAPAAPTRRSTPRWSSSPPARPGVRLWEGLEGLEGDYQVEATAAPSGVTHLTFTRTSPSTTP